MAGISQKLEPLSTDVVVPSTLIKTYVLLEEASRGIWIKVKVISWIKSRPVSGIHPPWWCCATPLLLLADQSLVWLDNTFVATRKFQRYKTSNLGRTCSICPWFWKRNVLFWMFWAAAKLALEFFHWHLGADDWLQSGPSRPKLGLLWSFLASQLQKQTNSCRQESKYLCSCFRNDSRFE